jgi:hypothetical protein
MEELRRCKTAVEDAFEGAPNEVLPHNPEQSIHNCLMRIYCALYQFSTSDV